MIGLKTLGAHFSNRPAFQCDFPLDQLEKMCSALLDFIFILEFSSGLKYKLDSISFNRPSLSFDPSLGRSHCVSLKLTKKDSIRDYGRTNRRHSNKSSYRSHHSHQLMHEAPLHPNIIQSVFDSRVEYQKYFIKKTIVC